jgi:thioredoxin-related protein
VVRKGGFKVTLARILGIACAFLASASLVGADEVEWSASLPEALKLAEAHDKIVMADFYTEWCGWCKKLDTEVYTDSRVTRIARDHFVAVKIDGDKHEQLVHKYEVRGYPTIVFLEPDGQELKRIRGFEPAKLFAADMLEVLELSALRSETADLEKAAAGGEKAADAQARLAYIYRRLGKEELAMRYLTKAKETGLDSADLQLELALLTERGADKVRSLKTWLQANPGHAREWEARFELGLACAEAQDWEQAAAVLEDVAKNAPQELYRVRSEYLVGVIQTRFLRNNDECAAEGQ